MGLQPIMRLFSIRVRMVGAIGVVLALLVGVGGAGLWGMQNLQAISHEFVEHAFEETKALARLRLGLADLARYEKEMVIQYESPEQLSQAHLNWGKARQVVRAQIQLMQQGEADEDNVVLQGLEKNLAAYEAAVEPVVNNMRSGGYDSATVANRMLDRAHQSFVALETDMKKIETIIAAEAAALRTDEEATARITLIGFAVAVGLAMFVVVPTTLANMQSICQPLNAAQNLAASIAKGDLTQPVQTQGKDELTALMHALGMMQASLSRIVGEVRNSTNSIGTASVEIASGNQDLSNRTEQAAGSLQQAASSLEQINGMVSQSVESARQASAMASINADVAARGGQVVKQVVATMDEINHSSRKIDGIAFQTNILALNAAVEAARAGESGRGFAVVAGEVRNLARRSAEAAQEIKILIGASVDKVEAGTHLVAEAGQTIGEIVTHAQKISAFINDITTAASEQSQGIGQVNSAVGQLDQMTQQNAALVEESAAAAENLRDQAGKLSAVVATFQLA